MDAVVRLKQHVIFTSIANLFRFQCNLKTLLTSNTLSLQSGITVGVFAACVSVTDIPYTYYKYSHQQLTCTVQGG